MSTPRHAPAASQPRISLAGVFDPARVEDILNSLLATIDQQSARIQSLEAVHASASAAPITLDSVHVLVQQLGADTRATLHALNSRVAAVEQQCAAVRDAAPRWDAGVQAQRALVSVAQLNAVTAQFEATQQKMWDDFQETRRDVSVVHEIESSQHRLAEQMAAVQSLLATKVDRTEAPLLKAAADTLRDADEFRAAAQRRLDVLEADVAAARRVLAAKEDKETVVQRMQKVAEQLAKKADSAWIASDVVAPHQHLDARFADLSRRYVDDALAARVAAAEDGVRAAAAVVARVEGAQRAVTAQAETLQAQMNSKAGVDALRLKVDATELQSTLDAISTEVSAELNRMQRALVHAEQSASHLQSTLVSLDQKTTVCLKFVDWYSDAAAGKSSRC